MACRTSHLAKPLPKPMLTVSFALTMKLESKYNYFHYCLLKIPSTKCWSACSGLDVLEEQHDDVIKWKHFPRYWPFVRGIHRPRWIPRTKASDAELWCFLWLHSLNKRLSKQSRGWWFETPSRPLWRHSNVYYIPWNIHTVHALLCFVVIWWRSILSMFFRVTSLARALHTNHMKYAHGSCFVVFCCDLVTVDFIDVFQG